jgi:hypothetical protein
MFSKVPGGTVNQALYPKLTHQTENDPAGATKTVRLSLVFWAASVWLSGSLCFTERLLVRLARGPGFDNSVSVLRVFAFWIPLVALSTVVIFQRSYCRIIWTINSTSGP